jgi:O-antigen/teichoic acid export membrane protein
VEPPQQEDVPPAGATFRERLISSLAWSAAAVPFAALFPWLASIVLYRTLGAAGFATYVVLRSVADSALLYTDLGLSTVVQRFLPELRDWSEERRFLTAVVAAKGALIGSLAVLLLIWPEPLLAASGLEDRSTAAVIIVLVLVAERNVQLLAQAVMTADLRLRTLTIFLTFSGFLTQSTVALAAVLSGDATVALATLAAGELVQNAVLIGVALRRPHTALVPNAAPVVGRRAAHYLASALLLKLGRYVQGPAFAALVLSAIASQEEVAAFAVMFTFVSGGLGLLATPLTRMSTSVVATAFASSVERGRATVMALTKLSLLLTVPAAVGVCAVGGVVIETLYGAEAEPSSAVISVLAAMSVLSAVGSVATVSVQNVEAFRRLNFGSLAAFVLGGAAVLVLGDAFGMIGVAVGLLVGASMASGWATVLLLLDAGVRFPLGFALRLAVASAPLGLLAGVGSTVTFAPADVFLVSGSLLLSYTLFRVLGGIGAKERSLLAATPHPAGRLISRVV